MAHATPGHRLALPVLALLLAGCSGGGPAGAPSGPGDGGPSGDGEGDGDLAGLPRPDWSVGDAWTYSFNGEATTYVVASETPTDWIMETDSPERAFADLREDISRLGPQRKSDLAGSQGDARVEFFRWPLADGAAWTTTWDGQPVTIAATVDAAEGRADLTAHDASGALVYRYAYDAGQRWFSGLTRFAADGSVAVDLVLTSAVHTWTGTLVRWEVQQPAHSQGNESVPLTVSGTFEAPAGATDLWMDYHFTCTGFGGFSVLVEPLNPGLAAEQRMEDSGACAQVDWTGAIVTAPHPGTWAYTINAGGQTVRYDYTLLVRTRVDVPFPA